MKQVQFPRNTTVVEDGVIGPEGQVRVDTTRKELRLHDGVTPGGIRIPNYELVQQLIAGGGSTGAAAASVVIYATEADMKAATPPSTSLLQLAVVVEAGAEALYFWKFNGSDNATVDSDVSGTWHRFDSQEGSVDALWRAGLLTVDFGAVEPVASQDTTPWLHSGVLKFWDGDSYEVATPALYARFLAKLGNYFVGSYSLPTRLNGTLDTSADLNAIVDSGWYATLPGAGTANSPISGQHAVEHRTISGTMEIQRLYVQDTAVGDKWVRVKNAGAWGAWVSVAGQLPARLDDAAVLLTDLNTALANGWYYFASTAAHAPAAVAGALIYGGTATEGFQLAMLDGASGVWYRMYAASAWGAWAKVYPPAVLPPPDFSDITGLPTTLDGFGFTDAAAVATVSEWRTAAANRVLLGNIVWSGMAAVALADAATVVWNLSLGFDFTLTLAGNRTLAFPTSGKVGQRGRIRIQQDGTGNRTLALAANLKTAGGLAITLSTAAGAVDVLYYDYVSSTECLLSLMKGIA